jgi:hypothetical protein
LRISSARDMHMHMRMHTRHALCLQYDEAEAAGLVDGADSADGCRDRQLPVWEVGDER